MEIISSIATKISEYAIDAIIHQFGYIVNFKGNMKDLKEQAENLVSAKTRMQHLVDEAMDKAEDIEDNVHIWFTRVDEITQETYTFLINIGGEEKSCLTGSCFNPVQRHRLSRKAKKMAYELAKIQEQGKSIDKVSYLGPLPGIDFVPHYQTFESRMSIMEEIMTGLKDPNIYMIGMYGMGGIGKTMLVREISCQVKKSKLLKPVIMATVGQNSDVRHIQGLLGDQLNLTFSQETEEGRADLLRKRLQTEKKFLIIFDDIWNGIDLERVGIPSTGDDKGRKIFVTSRSKHVLSNEMSIENNFEVKDLAREESWKFFKNIVGESIETDRQLNKIAIDVANKCGKLPIALVIVAKALKGKPLSTWRDALRQLKNPASVDIEEVSREVYASLKLSYDNLNGREAQLLFLLCSIFPDDYNIHTEHLSRYAMGLKFLQGIDTLGTTRDKILTMVDHLISSCLLQKSDLSWGGETQVVKMHDVVRDVAIYIASKDDQMRTLSYGKGLNKWHDEKTHGHYNAILVNCTDFQDLPEKFNFPKVELLSLITNSYTKNDLWIREGCLEGMESLKVLQLEKLHFSIPPSSFNYLVNLRILSLTGCRLGSIDMIGDLKHLEILDLSNSDIVELPLSVRQLSRLKELNLSNCEQLEVIPPGVISRLTSLEELYLKNSFDGWGVEGFVYSQKKNASLSELNYLPCLRRVYLCIPNVRYLPEKEFLNNSELESFRILIGKHWEFRLPATKKMLDIKTDSRNVLFKEWINRLLITSEELALEATSGVKNVLLELNRSMSPHLRYLRLGNNEDVEYIVDQKLSYNGFSILVYLKLWNMRRLVTIIQGYSVKTVNVFEKLETLTVENCEKMKYLFPFSIMKALRNLENIYVRNCEILEAIVVIENEEQIDATIEFRRLRILYLVYLPQLIGFCCKVKAKKVIQSQSSEIVEEVDEDQLITNAITPFDGQIGFPNSKKLHIERLHNVKNIWHDLVIANNFIELDQLYVYDCENLITIFDGETTENQTQCIRELKLRKLPNLKQVWNEVPDGDVISFQCLTRVTLKECQELKRLFPSYLSKHLQQLEYLKITKCGIDEIFESELEIFKVSFPSLMLLEIRDVDNLEIIWHNRLIVDDMYKLQFVELNNCKSLKSIFTSNVMKALKKLKELSIQNCDSIEDVFEIDRMTDQEEQENHEVATINLKKLKLCNLQNLKHVWSNDPYGMYQFQNLQDVEVIECPKLETIFPPSLARDLPYHLQRLHVDVSLDEIFMNQETSKTETLEAEIRLDKDTFIKLREMELDGKKAIRELLCHPNFSKDLFPALKVVKLNNLDDYESAPFSLEFHQLLYNLEELKVHKAFLVEIFSYDKAFTTTNERNQSTRYSSSTLKKLDLRNLPKLLHIWKQGSHTVQPSFDNLEDVHVENCSRLVTLVISSSFSFQNLKQLTICKCHGLSYLLDPSVAKTMARLKTMNLFECKNMTAVIVGREDEREEDEIVFRELEVLQLYDLPKLKMFQLAKGAIRFPYLKTLAIKQCPEMTTFTHGPGLVCTPLLKSITDAVKSQDDDVDYFVRSWTKPKPNKYWAGNINATIRRLWEDDFHDSIHSLFKDEVDEVLGKNE